MIKPAIKRKILLVREYLTEVLPYAELSVEELIKNKEKLATMERFFLLMVDEAVDVNAALTYHLGNKVAESYKFSFLELVTLGILDHEFADRIAGTVKVRNEMTHDYEKRQKSDYIVDIKKSVELYKTYTKILINKFVAEEK